MIEFRRARPGDGMTIARTRQRCWDTTYRGIYLDSQIDQFDYEWHAKRDEILIARPDFYYWLVMDGDACVGYYSYGEIPEGTYLDFRFRLRSLYLLKEYRGRGLGRKMMESVFAHAKDLGHTRLYLECSQHNLDAQSYYIRLGGIVYAIDGGHENPQEDTCYFEFYL